MNVYNGNTRIALSGNLKARGFEAQVGAYWIG